MGLYRSVLLKCRAILSQIENHIGDKNNLVFCRIIPYKMRNTIIKHIFKRTCLTTLLAFNIPTVMA